MNRVWTTEEEEAIKERLGYNPETGDLIRKEFPGCVKKLIGTPTSPMYDKDGYKRVGVKGTTYKAHRVAYFLYHGVQCIGQIDHKDRDVANNRIDNLLDVTHQINQYNKDPMVRNKTGVPGVSIGKVLSDGTQTYEVRVGSGCRANNRSGQYIGSARNVEDATKLRDAALELRLSKGSEKLTKEEILGIRTNYSKFRGDLDGTDVN